MTKSMFHDLKQTYTPPVLVLIILKNLSWKFNVLYSGFYQSNQSVSVKDEIMLCCVDVADKSVHSFDLECRRYDEDVWIYLTKIVLAQLCTDMLNNEVNCNIIVSSSRNDYVSVLHRWLNEFIKARLHKLSILKKKLGKSAYVKNII